jgi:hypothetical protein
VRTGFISDTAGFPYRVIICLNLGRIKVAFKRRDSYYNKYSSFWQENYQEQNLVLIHFPICRNHFLSQAQIRFSLKLWYDIVGKNND